MARSISASGGAGGGGAGRSGGALFVNVCGEISLGDTGKCNLSAIGGGGGGGAGGAGGIYDFYRRIQRKTPLQELTERTFADEDPTDAPD